MQEELPGEVESRAKWISKTVVHIMQRPLFRAAAMLIISRVLEMLMVLDTFKVNNVFFFFLK